ncbi:MAG TPA: hypothetical protein VFT00_02640 [Nocardioides sp.]|nr:hypothetical protein [Nocardioides sp.]
MRFRRPLALLGVLLLCLALGPWVLVAALGSLFAPRVREWLRPTRRVVGIVTVVLVGIAGLVVVIPDGWLPIPPGPGALVTPAYVGRPASARPIRMAVPVLPGLADGGEAGPLGESPEVDSAWYGLTRCATPAFDSHGRLVTVCRDRRAGALEVIDPDSMRPLVTKELPELAGELDDACADAPFHLDDDRAAVATADRHVLLVETADAGGDADLTTRADLDLSEQVPADDCLVGLAPDGRGRIWFATRAGRVGAADVVTGNAAVIELDEQVDTSLAVHPDGDAYVVTNQALYRLGAGPGGKPTVTWRAAYDRGSERKSGQPSQGSGTSPVLLAGGLVAITDNANPRMHVLLHDRANGSTVCSVEVFEDDRGATASSLVPVGDGVIVENNHGHNGPLSTVLGRTTDAGLARVDVAGGTCRVAWTSTEAAPSADPALSPANGLLYAHTKQHSWWGADAWYLTAIDARTGRRVFGVRTGLGPLAASDAGVAIAPDGSAYVATVGGIVRVHDRR